MSCCSSIYNLGCVNFCDTVVTGLTATSTGTYTIKVIDGGNYAEYSFTIGQAISFTNIFNENGITVFQVLNPSGTAMTRSGSDCLQVEVTTGFDFT